MLNKIKINLVKISISLGISKMSVWIKIKHNRYYFYNIIELLYYIWQNTQNSFFLWKIKLKNIDKTYLIRVRKSAHPAHNAEDIVVSRIDVYSGGEVGADRVVRHREEEGGVINAG